MRIVALWAILAFGLDQLSKWFVVHWLDLWNRLTIDVLPPLLNFRMGWNTGINFGLFGGSPDAMRWVLTGLAVVISIALLVWAKRSLTRPIALAGVGMIVGGAMGNAVDRVVYGAVADFLNMSCCGIQNPFTFNVADIFIFAGAFAIVIFDEKKSDTNSS